MSRRTCLRLGATGAAAGVLGLVGHAQPPFESSARPEPATSTKSGAEFINQDTQAAIDRGLDFLARSQMADGSFRVPEHRQGDLIDGAVVGITALAGLALMGAGNQPNRGKYGKTVARAVEFVSGMANGHHTGFLTTPESQALHRLANNPAPMYSHGFGTLFLSEVCGMLPSASRDNKLRGVLEQAVAFTVSAQNTLGGWRYEPLVQFADVSVTTAQMMALRAARNAGVFVGSNVVKKGADFIRGCQMPDGGFRYLKAQGGGSAFARSAASIVGLYSAGIYEGEVISRGLKYLQQFTPGRLISAREVPPPHYWYGQYYAALAMWTAGDTYWNAWLPAIRDELLAKARANGGMWIDTNYGNVYATAMALIVLQLPNNYLPILQK